MAVKCIKYSGVNNLTGAVRSQNRISHNLRSQRISAVVGNQFYTTEVNKLLNEIHRIILKKSTNNLLVTNRLSLKSIK